MNRRGHAGRTDGNHGAVVDALRGAGIAVRSLAQLGDGMPDLLCAYRGVMVLLELKDGSKPESARRLTAAQVEFLATWPAPVFVVDGTREAVRVVVDAASPGRCTACRRLLGLPA